MVNHATVAKIRTGILEVGSFLTAGIESLIIYYEHVDVRSGLHCIFKSEYLIIFHFFVGYLNFIAFDFIWVVYILVI